VTGFIVRRILAMIPLLIIVSIFVFSIMQLAGGNAALVIGGTDATQEELAQITERYGLNRPMHEQYRTWLTNAVQGDLGQSLLTRRPVTEEIRTRILPTAELAFTAMAIALLVGVLMGIMSARRPNSLIDNICMLFSFIGVAMPVFGIGLALIYFLGVHLGWLPTGGAGGLRYLVLPAITLSVSSIAILARMTRSSTLDVIRHDYVRTARAKGLAEGPVFRGHVLRNGLIPVITVVGLEFGSLLSGAVITETVFSRPGIGRLLVEGIRSRDYPVVQGVLLLLAVVCVTVNLIVDIVYMLVDPRIQGVG